MNLLRIANLPFAKQDEARREQMKLFREDMEALTAEVTASFANATANQSSGMFDVYINIATKRIQEETEAKVAAAAKLRPSEFSVWKNKPEVTSVEAGGSTIDFSADTITLTDGTVIDIKTGVKKVNLIV